MSHEKSDADQVVVDRRPVAIEECLDYALLAAVAYSGGILTGFSVKIGEVDILLTLRARFPAGHMIAWVGGDSIADILLKAKRFASSEDLRWKDDKYRQE